MNAVYRLSGDPGGDVSFRMTIACGSSSVDPGGGDRMTTAAVFDRGADCRNFRDGVNRMTRAQRGGLSLTCQPPAGPCEGCASYHAVRFRQRPGHKAGIRRAGPCRSDPSAGGRFFRALTLRRATGQSGREFGLLPSGGETCRAVIRPKTVNGWVQKLVFRGGEKRKPIFSPAGLTFAYVDTVDSIPS